MEGYNWLALAADYFEPVAREVFEKYMQGYGFGTGEADEVGCLTYRRGNVFLRVHYYVEESPNYSPMVSIGLTGAAQPHAGFDRIGLWYALPADSELRDYELWIYSNADELRRVLTRIRDEVIEVYARPLWDNEKQLAGWLKKRFEEDKAEREQEILSHNKQQAERAFRSQDYRKAATLYGLMKDSDLSPVERKRYELAKKRAS